MAEMTFSEMTAFMYQLNKKMDMVLQAVSAYENKKIEAPKDFMDLEAAAAFICRSKSTLYGLVNRREIPYSKTGKRLLFSRSDLESWIKSSRVITSDQTIEELEQDMINLNKKKK